jgi:hypothetical protein
MPARTRPTVHAGSRSGGKNLKANLVVSADCKTYISSTQGDHDMQGDDDMNDHDVWISYSHWGMFLAGANAST